MISLFLALLLAITPAYGQSYDATVLRVIDGDTIEVRIGGQIETVRYIGVNTPEIQHPTKGREPYGEEAKQENRRLVESRQVRLELDIQPRDKYGRLLAYVYRDGQMVNGLLVQQGYAETSTYPPNVRHQHEFLALQADAFQARIGLWGDPEAVQHYKPRGSGVIGRKGVRVYLHPHDPTVQQIGSDDLVYFENEQEAKAAGFIPSMHFSTFQTQERSALRGDRAATISILNVIRPSSSSTPGGPPLKFGSSSSRPSSGGDVNVRGYQRRDGATVQPYTRSAPKR